MKYARLAIQTITVIVLIVACLVSPNRVNASGGLTVSPPLKEITLNSGLIQTSFEVTLKNTTGKTINATYKLVDLKSLGQYGGSTLDKAGLPDAYNLTNWMRLAGADKQKIANGETAIIKTIIDNRTDLSPGGHYGAVIITTSPESASEGSVNLNQQIISLVFVKKLGGEKYGLNLESLKPNKSSSLPNSAELLFRNTGNVHVTPRGYVEITDPKGKLVAKGIINPDSSIVLPDATRKYVTIMQSVSNSSVAGKYKITAYYRYDGQAEFSTKSLYFERSVSAKTIVLVALLSLLVIASLSAILINRKSRKTRKKSHLA